MAFQSDTIFSEFLRGTTRSAALAESAPAINFLLEERLPNVREQRFLTTIPGAASGAWTVGDWLNTYGNHYNDHVGLPVNHAKSLATFAPDNLANHLALESHQDVVRLESLGGLFRVFPGDFDSAVDLAAELRSLVQSRPAPFDEDRRNRLESWLEELNRQRDARPAFAAPFGEVETLLAAPDWATQLRNVLGLSHLAGSPGRPLPVVLCRYNLSRVERAARRARIEAWAAAPTVLEAGGGRGPGSAFFPFPRAAASSNPFGFGITVSLADDGGLDFKSELLHFKIDYRLEDFAAVGELTDGVTEAQLDNARRRHFGMLEADFSYRSDVP